MFPFSVSVWQLYSLKPRVFLYVYNEMNITSLYSFPKFVYAIFWSEYSSTTENWLKSTLLRNYKIVSAKNKCIQKIGGMSTICVAVMNFEHFIKIIFRISIPNILPITLTYLILFKWPSHYAKCINVHLSTITQSVKLLLDNWKYFKFGPLLKIIKLFIWVV